MQGPGTAPTRVCVEACSTGVLDQSSASYGPHCFHICICSASDASCNVHVSRLPIVGQVLGLYWWYPERNENRMIVTLLHHALPMHAEKLRLRVSFWLLCRRARRCSAVAAACGTRGGDAAAGRCGAARGPGFVQRGRPCGCACGAADHAVHPAPASARLIRAQSRCGLCLCAESSHGLTFALRLVKVIALKLKLAWQRLRRLARCYVQLPSCPEAVILLWAATSGYDEPVCREPA